MTSPARVRTPLAASGMLRPVRLDRAKRSFTTRGVQPLHTDRSRGLALLAGADVRPRAGDLVLAKVSEIGQHRRLERPDGRRATLFEGDEIVVVYGARYAPDQFEGVVPKDLGPCDLLAAGGVAGHCVARSELVDEPTRLQPIGLLAHEGRRLSLRDWAPVGRPAPLDRPDQWPVVIGVVGTAMNAGKTTALAGLVRGLTAGGSRVGAAKITGTGAGGDLWHYQDAGAEWAYDFTDAGYPTTYQVPIAELEQLAVRLVDHIAARSADVVVVEVADGVFQKETAALLASPVIRGLLDGILFAAGDALGAAAGAQRLTAQGYDVRGVSGRFTASPLALREAREFIDDFVVGSYELCDPAVASAVARVEAPVEESA